MPICWKPASFLLLLLFSLLACSMRVQGRTVTTVRGSQVHLSHRTFIHESGKFEIATKGWSDNDSDDMRAIMYSTANALLMYFPNERFGPILAQFDPSGPKVVCNRKGPSGETIILLSAKCGYWDQLVYQFSHELAHVLSNSENKQCIDFVTQNELKTTTQWFEESLGETASLFVLRQLALSWRVARPVRHMRQDYPNLTRKYVDDIMNNPSRNLPPGMTLAGWYNANKNSLINK